MKNDLAPKIIEATRASYNAIADKFTNSRVREWPLMKTMIEKYVKPGQAVLDVGCGSGRLAGFLADYQVDYTGVDNSQALIDLAPKNLGHFMVKDILNLDFKQEFDAVFTFAVISHLPTDELRRRAIQNIFAATRPGGVAILTNWNFWRLTRREKSVWRYKIFERGNSPSLPRRGAGLPALLRKALLAGEVAGVFGKPPARIATPASNAVSVASAGWQSVAGGPPTSPLEKGERLAFKDVMTYFKVGEVSHPLYYYAFTLGEMRRLVLDAGFEVIDSFYDKKGVKSWWGAAENLVVVARRPGMV